jgi:hypothetical protein
MRKDIDSKLNHFKQFNRMIRKGWTTIQFKIKNISMGNYGHFYYSVDILKCVIDRRSVKSSNNKKLNYVYVLLRRFIESTLKKFYGINPVWVVKCENIVFKR